MIGARTKVGQKLCIFGMWVFLGPLIIILGTVDVLSRGRSRKWPLDYKWKTETERRR
jgi:hypothetical protein